MRSLAGSVGPSPRCAAPASHARRTAVLMTASSAPTVAPTVKLTINTKEGPTVELDVESGDKLRDVLMANKVELYTTWGKVWSCGGGGQCGTCIVDVKSGADILTERTGAEKKKLSGKPESFRLACQTLVGDGENSGAVTIATKP